MYPFYQRLRNFMQSSDRLAVLLFALAIPLSGMTNIVLHYLGLCLEENIARSALFIAVNIMFAVAAAIFFLYTMLKRKLSRSNLVLLATTLVFYCGCYMAAYLHHGLSTRVVNYGQQFIIFCIPAFLAGAVGAAWSKETQFFATIEQFGIVLAPACIQYLLGLVFQCNPFVYGTQLGIIGYMSIAYTIMPVLMALCVQFAKKSAMQLPFTKQPSAHPQRVRGILIAILWLAMMATGTRGPILCMIFFFALLMVYQFIWKSSRKHTAWMCGIMTGILLVNIFVIPMPGLQRLSRMNLFLEGLQQGQLSTTDAENLTDKQIDQLMAMPPAGSTSTEETEQAPSGETEQAPSGETEQTPPEETEQTPSEEVVSPEEQPQINGNRGTLFRVALEEWKTSPLVGIGPFSYMQKYEYYPHSAALELLCETGILGIAIIFGLIFIAAIRILRQGENGWLMLLFILPYGMAANISGTVWACPYLLFALGYGLSLHSKRRKQKQEATVK